MGTSGSFGGSKTWSGVVSGAGDAGSGSGQNWTPSSSFGKALASALGRGDRQGRKYSVAELLAGSGGGGGSSASGDGRRGGSTPPFTRDAARGALVFAAIEAIEANDAGSLTELGIDLAALAGLSERALFLRLMDTILGPPSHPEDRALRQAVLAALRAAPAGQPLSQRIAAFVAALAWERTSVQLASATERGSKGAGKNSDKIKRWIGASVNRVADVLTGSTPGALADFASKVAAKACALFGKERK
ncbi:hypothetical protein BH11ACT5_BH11ACT5_10170 [soil metagenome]